MLYCDQQCEGCCVWYHHDCLGLSLAEGQRLGASGTKFVCPHCTDIDTSTPSDHPASAIIEQDPSTVRDSSHISKPCTDFLWSDISGEEVCSFLMSAYEEVIHWKLNIFLIPFGKVGKSFVQELAMLYRAFAEGSALRSIALMACSVMQPLLLQKPFRIVVLKITLLTFLGDWNCGARVLLMPFLRKDAVYKDHLRSSSRNKPNDRPSDV